MTPYPDHAYKLGDPAFLVRADLDVPIIEQGYISETYPACWSDVPGGPPIFSEEGPMVVAWAAFGSREFWQVRAETFFPSLEIAQDVLAERVYARMMSLNESLKPLGDAWVAARCRVMKPSNIFFPPNEAPA